MFAKNVVTFLTHLVKDGKIVINLDDEITRETLVTRDGKVVHARWTAAAVARATMRSEGAGRDEAADSASRRQPNAAAWRRRAESVRSKKSGMPGSSV